MKIAMPKNAEKIIDKLMNSGHIAFIVGGCVRDSILGREANDFDITTSATPDETKALFERTIDTGIAHGTVTVIMEGEPYEVTTFRVDGEYNDSRHPDSVTFTKRIEDDLARRDFTVNAMAYNYTHGIVDVFSGMDDLRRRVIRAVGDPKQRFSEDALRILRAIRFSSVLDFDIEEKTAAAARALSGNLALVSGERIFAEMRKLIGGKRAYRILIDFCDIIKVFLPEFDPERLPPEKKFLALGLEYRMAALLSSLGKSGLEEARQRLKMDNKTYLLADAVMSAKNPSDASEVSLKLHLIKYGDEVARASVAIGSAYGLYPETALSDIDRLIAIDTPRTLSHLAIGGKDAMAIGIMGKEIGKALGRALTAVAMGLVENEKDELISYLKTSEVTE
ncbi:MAG: CCA tRNA nucleotidyltransferase [Clostridia bacterium]|nr:CCA tRNA nucleotidyltransferase [Clostridia bacterium]